MPQDIANLEAFRAAFAEWDAGHPDVTVTQPRDLTIAGRPATSVDVIAGTICTIEPGIGPGDILERDFAIDIGDRVLIVRPARASSGQTNSESPTHTRNRHTTPTCSTSEKPSHARWSFPDGTPPTGAHGADPVAHDPSP